MTREEAIDLLDNLIGIVDDNHDSDYDTAIKMGIKALKQNTSFINKPCISIGVCHEDKIKMLDKISAEIEMAKEKWWSNAKSNYFVKLSDVLQIIDKYKEEGKNES